MLSVYIYALTSVLVVSLVSLVGIVVIAFKEKILERIIFILVSLSVGALFGDVFIHLLPELFASGKSSISSSIYVLVGILLFFILEKFLRWHHKHDIENEDSTKHIGYINLVSDGVHNLIDGIFIGVAYLVSIPVGIATTVAVFLHEIPQEIGDFGVLLHAGFTKSRALLLNLLSALFSIVGVIIALSLGSRIESSIELVLGITAGTFIYIAGSDLVPELHKVSDIKKSFIQLIAIVIGILLMLLLFLIEQ